MNNQWNQWGCLGLLLGSLFGLLLALLGVIILRIEPEKPIVNRPPGLEPDLTIFISEQSLSRLASQTLDRPLLIDFEANGQVEITTQVPLGPVEPVLQAGLDLEMFGTEVVSQLRWVRLGFLSIPAGWLPSNISEIVSVAGQTIQNQTPPDFILLGLETSPEGVTFELKWVGE